MLILAEVLGLIASAIGIRVSYEKILDYLEAKIRKEEDRYYKEREFVVCPKCGASTSLSDDEKDLVVFDCLNCNTRWADHPTHVVRQR